MTIFIRLLIASSLILLGGCASVEHHETVNKLIKISPNIAFPPAIDVPYSDAVSQGNTGLTVRWGGEVIESSKIDKTLTRLTVSALPLTTSGLPAEVNTSNQKVNYFTVDLNDSFSQSVNLNGSLVTLYGDVAEQKTVLIDNQQLLVPSIKLREIVAWDLVYREKLAYIKRQNPGYYHNVKPNTYSRGGFGHGFR